MKTQMTDYENAAQEAQQLFDSLALKTETSNPMPDVRDGCPSILYRVSFSRNGTNFATEYRLGVGHVQWPKRYEDIPNGTDPYLVPVFNTLRHNPSAQLKDKSEHAAAASWLAKCQKVAPKPYEVLAYVCDDAHSAHNESFEDYASNFGMDADSIKAKRIYDDCAAMYHKLVALVGSENVQKLVELHGQF